MALPINDRIDAIAQFPERAFNLMSQHQRHNTYWCFQDMFWHSYMILGNRDAFREVAAQYDLHPLIKRLVDRNVRPVDWQLLLLEWPGISEGDKTKLAYTRSDEHRAADRRTVTTLGKYLKRHYPNMPDDLIRDLSAVYTGATNTYEIWHTTPQIMQAIEFGPRSCMQSEYGSIPFNSVHRAHLRHGTATLETLNHHPYACYAPEYGWGIAVEHQGDPWKISARALLRIEDKTFVRAYKRATDDSEWSEDSDTLRMWLEEQGYTHEREWADGSKLKWIDHPSESTFMAPYIDGGTQRVSTCSVAGEKYLVIDTDGEYACTNTDGIPEGHEASIGACEDCGDRVHESDEDRISAGQYESRLICGCCSANYRWVSGRGHNGRAFNYYVHENDACAVENADTQFDETDQPDNIVETVAGDFIDIDEPHNYVNIDGEWYHNDGDGIIEIDGEWHLKADCWEDADGEWHSDDEACVEVAGGKYTTDMLRALADNA